MSGFHKLHSGSALGSAHWRLSQGQVHCTCSRTCWSAVAWSYLGLWRIVTLLMVPLGSDCHWSPLVAIGRHWSPLVAIGGHWWPLVAIGVIIADWHRLTLSNWKSSVFCWGMIPSGIQAGAVCQDLPQFNAWQLLRRLRACCWDESPTQWFAGT